MLEMLSMLIIYFDRLGIFISLNVKIEECCFEDLRGCLFLLFDFFVEFLMFGYDMVDVSMNFFMIGLLVKIVFGLNVCDFIMGN